MKIPVMSYICECAFFFKLSVAKENYAIQRVRNI